MVPQCLIGTLLGLIRISEQALDLDHRVGHAIAGLVTGDQVNRDGQLDVVLGEVLDGGEVDRDLRGLWCGDPSGYRRSFAGREVAGGAPDLVSRMWGP